MTHYFSGTVHLSDQAFRQLQRESCASDAADIYAWTARRVDCVCGQHENPVPLPPALTDDPDDWDPDE